MGIIVENRGWIYPSSLASIRQKIVANKGRRLLAYFDGQSKEAFWQNSATGSVPQTSSLKQPWFSQGNRLESRSAPGLTLSGIC